MSICNSTKQQQDTRFTLRLPGDLLSWVHQQGGSHFIRDLLLQRKANGPREQPSGPPLMPESLLKAHWDHLADERESLDLERENLKDEEKVLDRRGDALDKKRVLLSERRELLEEEWYALGGAQGDLEEREAALAGAIACLTVFPHRLLL